MVFDGGSELERLRKRLKEIDVERSKVVAEISRLTESIKTRPVQNEVYPTKSVINISPIENTQQPPLVQLSGSSDLFSSEKVNLYRSLFRGRDDVYARFWQSKHSLRSGYSPVCNHEWNRDLCQKPKLRCSDCPNRDLVPVTDTVIRKHLDGKMTVGVYPLLKDDNCHFLAIDFDKSSWMEDISAFSETCKSMGIPTATERSRSGNGGHLWIFFSEAVSASEARKLGCYFLTQTMSHRHQIGLDSYDRLFPNQDTVPKGGFGNLIALPFQKEPSEKGNTLFLDSSFNPYQDQWFF